MNQEQARAAARDLLNEIHDCRREGLLLPSESEAAAIILRHAQPVAASPDVRGALEAAWAECDAWRSAMRGANIDNVLGMSERDATCVANDANRQALAQGGQHE